MRANGHGFSRRKGVLITGSPDSAAPLIILPKSIRHPSLAVSGSALRPGSREFAERWFSSSFLFLSFLSGGKCPDAAVYLRLSHQPRCRQEGMALVSASRLLPTWKVSSLWHLLRGVMMLPPACHPVPLPTRRLSSAPKGVTGMKQKAKQAGRPRSPLTPAGGQEGHGSVPTGMGDRRRENSQECPRASRTV